MDFQNLTEQNKTDIKDVVNAYCGVKRVTSVYGANLKNSTLTIYLHTDENNFFEMDYGEFRRTFNELILGA
jgi:hypothetical protein